MLPIVLADFHGFAANVVFDGAMDIARSVVDLIIITFIDMVLYDGEVVQNVFGSMGSVGMLD